MLRPGTLSKELLLRTRTMPADAAHYIDRCYCYNLSCKGIIVLSGSCCCVCIRELFDCFISKQNIAHPRKCIPYAQSLLQRGLLSFCTDCLRKSLCMSHQSKLLIPCCHNQVPRYGSYLYRESLVPRPQSCLGLLELSPYNCRYWSSAAAAAVVLPLGEVMLGG